MGSDKKRKCIHYRGTYLRHCSDPERAECGICALTVRGAAGHPVRVVPDCNGDKSRCVWIWMERGGHWR
jgi:hypothetical protein